MYLKMFLTIFVLVVFGILEFALNTAGTLYSAKAAGLQFQTSDMAYVSSMTQMAFWRNVYFVSGVTFLLIVFIWIKPIKNWLTTLALISLLLFSPSAYAYWDTTDRAEAYTVLPNESAFWIPDTGDRKNDQAHLDSESFLESNRISVTRFFIPHAKFQNSGGWAGFDKYVPTGRLIIVDRAQYSREWVDHTDRGTSSQKEGFPCQSKEGLDITVGISIGTVVNDGPQASRFLYNFGVNKPAGDRMSPEVIFTSVYFGRSLTQIMDEVVRKQVQTIVCRELGSRTLDDDNAQANEIMKTIQTETGKYLDSVGITLKFIGFADTFRFGDTVQKAIDDRYIADKLAPVATLLAQLNQLKVQEGMSLGIASHGLPIVVTPGMMEALENLVSKAPPPPTPTTPNK